MDEEQIPQSAGNEQNDVSKREARLEALVEKKKRRQSGALEWLLALAVAAMLAFLLTHVFFINARIPSGSMEDTIQVGDRVLGFRFSYWFGGAPQRGEIVIFRGPDDEDELFVKRVIGTPGDVVEMRDGQVFLNGAAQPLDEAYVTQPHHGNFGPYTVPENSYFVMGDNRDHSLDSRFWQNTYVPHENLIGRAVVRVFPNPTVLE